MASVAECAEFGKKVLTRDDVMESVPDLIALLQVKAVLLDGTKLVSCYNPTPSSPVLLRLAKRSG